MFLLEDIEDLFDEEISLEVLCADYLVYAFQDDTEANAETLLLSDYEEEGYFATLNEEDKLEVYMKLTAFFLGLWEFLVENEVSTDADPLWQVSGLRGKHHLILMQCGREERNQ